MNISSCAYPYDTVSFLYRTSLLPTVLFHRTPTLVCLNMCLSVPLYSSSVQLLLLLVFLYCCYHFVLEYPRVIYRWLPYGMDVRVVVCLRCFLSTSAPGLYAVSVFSSVSARTDAQRRAFTAVRYVRRSRWLVQRGRVR
ncbi:hypothetical protein PRIPAC_90499, partial [Pristionchus pacificus]